MKTSILSAAMTMALAGTASAASTTPAAPSEWVIDGAHSTAGFSVRHMVVSKTTGAFAKFGGKVLLDEKDPTKSVITVDIDPASIDTREPKRDAHLKSPDFFDVVKYPTLTFKSTKIEKAGKEKFKVTGDLTIHGVTKPVVLAVEGPTAAIKTPFGTLSRGVHATGKINRKDFGLTWNKALEAGGVVVGEDVELVIDAELSQKLEAPAAAAGAPAAKPAAAPAK